MTITFQNIPNFSKLPIQQATDIVYKQLVPFCEARKLYLSRYGNHVGQGSISPMNEYEHQKKNNALFDVGRIQRAYDFVQKNVIPASQYTRGSYGMKHSVEKLQKEYITNGDLIAAMLMSGYSARFAINNEPLDVNCDFMAIIVTELNADN